MPGFPVPEDSDFLLSLNSRGRFLHRVSLTRRTRNWLLTDEADPSIRHRVLRDLLERPPTDPEVMAQKKQIGREGWPRKSYDYNTRKANGIPREHRHPSCIDRNTSRRIGGSSSYPISASPANIRRSPRLCACFSGDSAGPRATSAVGGANCVSPGTRSGCSPASDTTTTPRSTPRSNGS